MDEDPQVDIEAIPLISNQKATAVEASHHDDTGKVTLTETLFKTTKARLPPRLAPLFQDFEEKYKPLFLSLEKKLLKISWSSYLEKKTGIHSTYWSIGGVVLSLIFFRILFKIAASLVTNVVGFVYPAYASMKAIETDDKGDDTQWLTYWTVYGSFSVVEHFSSFILKWIPFYYAAKIAILVWCFHPSTKGAEKVYKKLIRPYFLRYQNQIDSALEKGVREIKGTVADIVKGESRDD